MLGLFSFACHIREKVKEKKNTVTEIQQEALRDVRTDRRQPKGRC